jgi:hypothetical protein
MYDFVHVWPPTGCKPTKRIDGWNSCVARLWWNLYRQWTGQFGKKHNALFEAVRHRIIYTPRIGRTSCIKLGTRWPDRWWKERELPNWRVWIDYRFDNENNSPRGPRRLDWVNGSGKMTHTTQRV